MAIATIDTDRFVEMQKQVEIMSEQLDESTGASWFWALLFGPLWFIFIGNYKWALIVFIVAIFTFGIGGWILGAFVSYRAHREVAKRRAEKFVLLAQ